MIYKEMTKAIYIILILIVFISAIQAQIDAPNKTDASGVRIGKWMLLLNSDLQTTENADSAAYYKVINYVSGKAIGFVNYYYKSGKQYFQTPVKSIDPDVYTDGEIKYFNPNGDVIRVLSYQNGLLNGQADYYYPDGKPHFHGIYTDGQRTGVWKQWDIDGKYGIGSFKEEVPEGSWTFYYADGSLRSAGRFHLGKKNGIWTEYSENGDIAEGNYLDGLTDGTWICRYKNNKPCFYGSYRLGKMNGFWKEWNILGQLSQGNYIDDVRDGTWTFLDAQGNKTSEGTYLAGKQDGEWRKYDNIGNIIETSLFKDGVKVEVPVGEIQSN